MRWCIKLHPFRFVSIDPLTHSWCFPKDSFRSVLKLCPSNTKNTTDGICMIVRKMNWWIDTRISPSFPLSLGRSICFLPEDSQQKTLFPPRCGLVSVETGFRKGICGILLLEAIPVFRVTASSGGSEPFKKLCSLCHHAGDLGCLQLVLTITIQLPYSLLTIYVQRICFLRIRLWYPSPLMFLCSDAVAFLREENSEIMVVWRSQLHSLCTFDRAF